MCFLPSVSVASECSITTSTTSTATSAAVVESIRRFPVVEIVRVVDLLVVCFTFLLEAGIVVISAGSSILSAVSSTGLVVGTTGCSIGSVSTSALLEIVASVPSSVGFSLSGFCSVVGGVVDSALVAGDGVTLLFCWVLWLLFGSRLHLC